jgi:K319L-like, PKD domain
VNKCNNNNNNNNIIIINTKKILVASIALVFLLSSIIFTHQNQTMLLSLLSHQQQSSSSSLSSFLSSPIASLAYADKIKMKNKSLINDISDQLVKNSNGNNSKDELQNILQQVQMQISQIAGQDKATNAIKQIESVIELNPNGPLAQSLLFLAKQQATGNIVDVNKVTTDVARYAAAGGDSIVGLLEQSVSSSSSSSIMPPSPQQQEQQPSQSLPSSSTIASFGNNSSSGGSGDNNLKQQPTSQSSPSAYPSNDSSNYINTNNATDANTVVSNSSPNSTIKITAVDQPVPSLSRPQSSPYMASLASENGMSRLSNSAANYNSIANLLVNAGTYVTLNGGSSHDPDGDPIAFKWEQISGPLVTLNGDNAPQATFTSPSVRSNTTMLFRLTVTDQDGLSDSKTVQIMVIPTS